MSYRCAFRSNSWAESQTCKLTDNKSRKYSRQRNHFYDYFSVIEFSGIYFDKNYIM